MDASWCKAKGKTSVTLAWFSAFNDVKEGRCPPKPDFPQRVQPQASCSKEGRSAAKPKPPQEVYNLECNSILFRHLWYLCSLQEAKWR